MLAPFDLLSFKLSLNEALFLTFSFFFQYAGALSFIQFLHSPNGIQIRFWVSSIVFVVPVSLTSKTDLCCLFHLPLQISAAFHFLKEHSDASFLPQFSATAK